MEVLLDKEEECCNCERITKEYKDIDGNIYCHQCLYPCDKCGELFDWSNIYCCSNCENSLCDKCNNKIGYISYCGNCEESHCKDCLDSDGICQYCREN